jgi:hypothetical protein
MIKNNVSNRTKSLSVNSDDELLRRLDRVVLADVRKAWTDCQSSRVRSAIYGYLHQVFMQVEWWSKNPEEKAAELQAFRAANPNVHLPDEEYAAVIACTADPNKMDEKTRSKFSRVLRYAAKYKPEKELLRDFVQRKRGHQQMRCTVYPSSQAKR